MYLVIMKFWCVIFIFGSLRTTHTQDDVRPLIQKSCSQVISFQQSIKKLYLETYKKYVNDTFYTTKVRTNYRTEFRRSRRNVIVCCSGYIEVNDMCQPICQPACGNGTCIAPHYCKCDVGYFAKHSTCQNFICVPSCSNDCVNGICSAPNVCTCNDGYSLSDDGYTCKPVCSSLCGIGSYCAQPHYCDCLSGYEEVTNNQLVANISKSCKPLCDSKCENGDCDINNTCVCHDGYQLHSHNIFLCKSKCDNNCVNGVCTASKVCICDKSYSLNKSGIREQICSNVCINDACVAPEGCKCFDDYGYYENLTASCEYINESKTCECDFGWTGKHCDKPTVCVLSLNNDEYRIKTLRIIEEYNATIEHVLMSNPKCPECINILNNETMCFKLYLNKRKNTSQIECLMDGECLQLMSQQKVQEKFSKIRELIIGLGILIQIGAIATYILLWKYRSRQQNQVARDTPHTMMQGLIEEED